MNRAKLVVALLAAIPALASASLFSKDYTESMIMSDSMNQAEARQMLIDKIRVDALNDAGARLKAVTSLTTGTTEADPTSTFTKTRVALIHVGAPRSSVSTNATGQVEIKVTANVTVDDAELQHADDTERKAKQQQLHIEQLESENRGLQDRNRDLKESLDNHAHAAELQAADQAMAQLQSSADQAGNQAGKDESSLPEVERNNNDLTPEQRVQFDQLCERFEAVDQMILNAGVQTTGLRVTWDWTSQMQIIRHLMGNVGTIQDNTYIVNGSEVNDKALLVAVRKCERANHFTVIAGHNGYDALFNAFRASAVDPNGKTWRLVFKGDYTVDSVARSEDADPSVAKARISDNMKYFTGDKNRLFGTGELPDPIRFGNEEMKAQAQVAVKPKHNRVVSFFGRVFAVGIQSNQYNPDKCAEYGGKLTSRPRPGGPPGSTYFSCDSPSDLAPRAIPVGFGLDK